MTTTRWLSTAEISGVLRSLMDEFNEYQWAVAWAFENELVECLLENCKKIKRLVIGTHFFQTDPKFLLRLVGHRGVKVFPPDGATFHPKVYLFNSSSKGDWACVIGSPNFTDAAFSRNFETAVLIRGKNVEHPVFAKAIAELDRFWISALTLDKDFLDDYELRYAASRRDLRKLRAQTKRNRPKRNARHPRLLHYNWQEYLKEILAEGKEALTSRINVLKEARRLFAEHGSLRDMSLESRQGIAGLLSFRVPHHESRAPLDWKTFGSMVGAGIFKNRIGMNNEYLSSALDQIPLQGEVQEKHYQLFARDFLRAFQDSDIKAGLPVASRLLAMKRPDCFLCINGPNRVGLCADLGIAASKIDLSSYWSEVIEVIMQSTWWISDRPEGRDRDIWDGRVAMLDAIYYDPTKRR